MSSYKAPAKVFKSKEFLTARLRAVQGNDNWKLEENKNLPANFLNFSSKRNSEKTDKARIELVAPSKKKTEAKKEDIKSVVKPIQPSVSMAQSNVIIPSIENIKDEVKKLEEEITKLSEENNDLIKEKEEKQNYYKNLKQEYEQAKDDYDNQEFKMRDLIKNIKDGIKKKYDEKIESLKGFMEESGVF